MISEIQSKFNEVLTYSQTGLAGCTPQTDELFKNWYDNKQKYIRAFDGFIWQSPEKVAFHLSAEEKQQRVQGFVETILYHYDNKELADFVALNEEGFFDNRVVYTTENEKISVGMRLLKAFKFFVEDRHILTAIQTKASEIISENNISGYLCLSVHPLDYLSASENNHNWRSCHALDGDYRSGNLSYMVDDCTVIAYLKSDEKQKLPNFPDTVPWNNKKWRMWLYFAKSAVYCGRQYPFYSSDALQQVRRVLNHFFEVGTWRSQMLYGGLPNTAPELVAAPLARLVTTYIQIEHYLYDFYELVKNHPDSYQFNDLLESSTYKDIIYAPIGCNGYWQNPKKENFMIEVGGPVNCVRCGEHLISASNTMLCKDCEIKYGECKNDGIYCCPCCGENFYEEDGFYIERDDILVCANCAENYYAHCDRCDSLVHVDDRVYCQSTDEHLCSDCYDYQMEIEEQEANRWREL